jgi:hypothetical protein
MKKTDFIRLMKHLGFTESETFTGNWHLYNDNYTIHINSKPEPGCYTFYIEESDGCTVVVVSIEKVTTIDELKTDILASIEMFSQKLVEEAQRIKDMEKSLKELSTKIKKAKEIKP